MVQDRLARAGGGDQAGAAEGRRVGGDRGGADPQAAGEFAGGAVLGQQVQQLGAGRADHPRQCLRPLAARGPEREAGAGRVGDDDRAVRQVGQQRAARPVEGGQQQESAPAEPDLPCAARQFPGSAVQPGTGQQSGQQRAGPRLGELHGAAHELGVVQVLHLPPDRAEQRVERGPLRPAQQPPGPVLAAPQLLDPGRRGRARTGVDAFQFGADHLGRGRPDLLQRVREGVRHHVQEARRAPGRDQVGERFGGLRQGAQRPAPPGSVEQFAVLTAHHRQGRVQFLERRGPGREADAGEVVRREVDPQHGAPGVCPDPRGPGAPSLSPWPQ